jgi:hypothetical protein
MRSVRAALGIALVVPTSACRVCPPRPPPLPTPGNQCTSDADCQKPFACQHPEDAWIVLGAPPVDNPGYCTRACRSNADCGAGVCDAPGLCHAAVRDAELLLLIIVQKPVLFEVTPWLQGAVGGRFAPGDSRVVPSFGAGVDGTFPIASFAPPHYPYCLPDEACPHLPGPRWFLSELRAGPWVALESTVDRARGEGGLALDLGTQMATSFSTLGVRAGAGYGSGGVAHVVGEISWGVRYVEMRKSEPQLFKCAATVAPVSGLRIFTAVRQQLVAPGALEVTMGIEWEPLGSGLGFDPRPAW